MDLLKNNKLANLPLSYKIEQQKFLLGWNPFRRGDELDYKIISALLSRRKSVGYHKNIARFHLKEKNRHESGSVRDYSLTAA